MRQRRFKRKFRDRIRDMFAGAILCAGLMNAASTQAKETNAQVRFTGGAYDKGKTPFIGIGLSGEADLGKARLGASLDAMFAEFRNPELDCAELKITFPINQYFAVSPFAYRSRYFGGIPFAAGAAFHIPKYNLHVAPHWVYGNNALPLPVSWTPKIGERVDLMIKIIVNAAHFSMEKPAPLIGGEMKARIKIVEGFAAYAKGFLMSARGKEGGMLLGAASMQGGLEFGL